MVSLTMVVVVEAERGIEDKEERKGVECVRMILADLELFIYLVLSAFWWGIEMSLSVTFRVHIQI